MNASVRADMLLDVLRRALHAFPGRADKPELNKILVQFEPGLAKATCTDGAFFVSAWCSADVQDEGEALFEREQIWEYLSAQGEQIVSFELQRKPGKYSGRIAISGKDNAETKIWSGEFWPAIMEPEDPTGSFLLTDEALATLAVAGVPATPSAEKNLLPRTRNVSVYQVDSTVYLTTAAVRFSTVRTSGSDIPDGGILVPLRYLTQAKKATGATSVGLSGTKLVLSGEMAWASLPTSGEATAISPEKYINYPDAPLACLRFGEDLLAVLKLCLIFGREEEGNEFFSATFKYDPEGFMDISSHVGTFKGRRVAATPGQEPFEELFHAAYVRDALVDLGIGAEVQIMPSPQEGKYWARIVHEDRFHIFMPMVPPKKGR